jgi:hypothetical protein
MGGSVAAIGGALMLGGVRRLIDEPRAGHALITGVGLAILANSRPYEGLVASLPAGVYLFVWMLSKRGPALSISFWRIMLPILTLLALTSAAMMYYNLRVTGKAFRMPYQVHEETYAMAPVFVWQDARPEPVYHHPVIRDFHKTYVLPLHELQHSIRGFALVKIQFFILLIFYFLNVLAIPLLGTLPLWARSISANRWSRFAIVTYSIFICGLLLETYFEVHYLAPITGLSYFFALSAMRLWRWRNRRLGRFISWLVTLLAVVTIVTTLIGAATQRNTSAWNIQRAKLIEQLKEKEGRHLVIVSYRPSPLGHDEWVYNGADIENAKVVWAREMDAAQNCRLIEYFKTHHHWLLTVDADKSKPRLESYPAQHCQ